MTSKDDVCPQRTSSTFFLYVFPPPCYVSRFAHGNGPVAPRADGVLAHPLGFDAARAQCRLPRGGGVGRRRVTPTRLSRGAVPRERDASRRVGRRTRCAGRADAAAVRPLRRPAARSAGRVDHAAVRADGARRQAVRARLGRRQGAGVLPPQGGRGDGATARPLALLARRRKSTRLNSSHLVISYAVFCLTNTR